MTIRSSWSRLLSIETYSVLILLFIKPHRDSINKTHLLPEPVLLSLIIDLGRHTVLQNLSSSISNTRLLHESASIKSTLSIELTVTEFEASKYLVKLPFPPIQKLPNAPEYPLFSMLSKWRDAMSKTMTEIVKHEQRWSSNRRPYLFMFLQGNEWISS